MRRRHHCNKGCSLNDDRGNAPSRRQILPGPPGLMRTGTTATEEVTPSVDSLDVVWRMLCTDEQQEDCEHDVCEGDDLDRWWT